MDRLIVVQWSSGSEFLRMIIEETGRKSRRVGLTGDWGEGLSAVWLGLRKQFVDGQILSEKDFVLIRVIIIRSLLNYRKSKEFRRSKRFSNSILDHACLENIESPTDSPDRLAANRELLMRIESILSKMPSHRSEALRSRFGLPDAPEWSDLIRNADTTRQNKAKHAKKCLEELKQAFSSCLR